MIIIFCCIFVQPIIAQSITAEDREELEQNIMNEIRLSDLEDVVGNIFPDGKITFQDLIDCALENDFEAFSGMAFDYIVNQIFYEWNYNKTTLIHVMVLALLAAIFTNFSNAFGNEQIANMGFYILYLLIIIIALQSFQIIVDSVIVQVNQVLVFMSALCPVFFLAIALSTGAGSAVVFYNLALLYIFTVEVVILSVVIPLSNTYIVVQVLNYLTSEKRLSRLVELIKLIINWILKIMIGGVIGLNVIQGLLAPMIDSVQRSVLIKGAEAIPVFGDAVGGTAEVILGTMQLIKNGIGVIGLIICIAIIAGPVIQMTMLTLLYKFLAAIVEPISDNRISGCLSGFGEGCEILLKILIDVGLLFLITIAIVTSTTVT